MMSSRGLLIATLLLLILGGGVWWSNRHEAAEEAKPKADTATKVIAVPDDQVTQLSLKREGGTETVLKRVNNKWEMVQPQPLPVDQEAANGITSTIGTLNADEVVEEKPSNLASYGLDTPSFELTVTKKDGKTEKVLLGDDTPTGGNVYAKTAADPRVFTVGSHVKTSLDKTPQDLRDKRLLTFDSDKLTRVELTAKNQTVEFGKNNQNEWQILRPSPMRADGYQVEELIRKLRDARMDLANEEDVKRAPAVFSSGTRVAIAKVTDASGTQTVEVRKAKDDYYAKSSVVNAPYKVAADLGTGLDKNLDDFRNKKLFDFGFSEPSKVEIRRDGTATAYAKSADKWFAGPKQIDSSSLQNFIDKLRDLSAASFVTTGFGAPTFEVTVVSNDGKRTEKVLVSKTGTDYLAKRDNEPALYKLDNNAAEEMMKVAAEIKAAEAPKPEKK